MSYDLVIADYCISTSLDTCKAQACAGDGGTCGSVTLDSRCTVCGRSLPLVDRRLRTTVLGEIETQESLTSGQDNDTQDSLLKKYKSEWRDALLIHRPFLPRSPVLVYRESSSLAGFYCKQIHVERRVGGLILTAILPHASHPLGGERGDKMLGKAFFNDLVNSDDSDLAPRKAATECSSVQFPKMEDDLCSGNCTYNGCSWLNGNLTQKLMLYNMFYGVPYNQQQQFLAECINLREPQRRTVSEIISKRHCTVKYTLPTSGKTSKLQMAAAHSEEEQKKLQVESELHHRKAEKAYNTLANDSKDAQQNPNLIVTIKEDGTKGLAKGWAPTFFGYSMQGLCKFGLYEVFKVFYSDILGEENSYVWRTSLYLAASASAEFFADIALSPMEAAKVQIQTKPGFVSTLREALPLIYKDEGLNGFYKSLVPLWMRQIPYTMMKFACFERTVELLYKYAVPKPRAQCTKGEQLVVTFAAGYIAGVFCAIVSHPADTVVSKLNQEKGSTAIDAAKKLGFAGLWKGLGPRIVMIGTLTAAQWFIYDAVKVWLRLPRPPPPEMPESLKKKLAGKAE
uniref:Phosphate carrier protein, mitochondrial n=2 Tax=Timema TaxID=61471 RepID=A0A7R9AZK5_TIMSH|nr:unnamed protein product [Timema shepardi]